MKKHIQDFEELKDHDPEGALEKLTQLEKKRIEERMTLKHKGSGKWAKLQVIRSKYDENVKYLNSLVVQCVITIYYLLFFVVGT